MLLPALTGRDKKVYESFAARMTSRSSTARWTELMTRGTGNENVGPTSQEDIYGATVVYETRQLMIHDETYYACSLDGVARVDLTTI